MKLSLTAAAVDLALLVCLCAPAAVAQSKLWVTVVDAMGAPIADLKAEDFSVLVDKSPRTVQKAAYIKDMVDVVVLMDTSAYAGMGRGEQIQRMAGFLIQQLSEREQMAVVAYASNADLLQDFTSSKPLLMRSTSGLKFGNDASVLDAVFASVDAGFQNAPGRRVLVVISTGAEGFNKVKRTEIVDLAETRKVSIFGISLNGNKDPLEKLAEETGGAYFSGKEMRQPDALAKNLFAAFRGHYEIEIAGNGEERRMKVEVKNAKEKLQVTQRRE